MKNKIKVITLTTLIILTLSACNTVEGVGRDMKALGGTVEEKAEDNKKY